MVRLLYTCPGFLSWILYFTGLLRLKEGDIIFIRNKYKPEEDNDILLGWVLDRQVFVSGAYLYFNSPYFLVSEEITEFLLDHLRKICDACPGPRHGKPTCHKDV